MNKVITINLNGNAYQVDETGYATLQEYLDAAEIQLKDNPDRREVMADLEQAIADKCQKFIGPHKNVVTGAEVAKIIAEMGPVDGSAGETGDEKADRKETRGADSGERKPPKRLYLMHEESMLSGVCSGIGAYFNVDPTIIRILFVIVTIATSGLFLLFYLLLALLIPYANTSEEIAAARGQPFNAQKLIDQAKENYRQFRNKKEWKKQWSHYKEEWMRKWREAVPWARNAQYSLSYSTRILAAVMLPVFMIASIALSLMVVVAIFYFIRDDAISGWARAHGIPAWVGLLMILAVFAILTAPLRAAHRASYYAAGFSHGGGAIWSGIIWLGLTAAAVSFGYVMVPEVHYIIDNFSDIARGIVGP
jgi:phage shock protein PspC (stress-responsive transcriptional regulator)